MRIVNAPVLVVDDDENARNVLIDALTHQGFRTIGARDGLEGLQKARILHPSVILLDLNMPVLDGRSFKRYQARDPDIATIPVIYVSGLDNAADVVRDLGGGNCVTKPVNVERLIDLVSHFTAMDEARQNAPTVLVVDDELAVHHLLSSLLEPKGYHVIAAASADDAIARLKAAPVDALVLDVRMPRRSGLEVLLFVRCELNYQHVPILLLTGATLNPVEEALVTTHRAYVFYKQENLENDFVPFIQRLCGSPHARG